MGSRRPPPTSYGYIPPPDARVRGWECRREGCGTGDTPAPRSWPFPCRVCGQPADPVFEQPWAHDAEGYRHRHDLTSTDRHQRTVAELGQHVWAYKDARFGADETAARAAWRAFRETRQRQRDHGDDWYAGTATYEMVRVAAFFGDLDQAAWEVLECYRTVDTRDVESDNSRRTEARSFVSMCINFLSSEVSLGHPQEAAVEAAMRDVAARVEGVLMNHHHEGFRHIGELRALHRSKAALVEARRSDGAARDGLPSVGPTAPRPAASTPEPAAARVRAPGAAGDASGRAAGPGGAADVRALLAEADTALARLDTHDDTAALDALAGRLEQRGDLPSLLHLLHGRRRVATGDLPAALRELEAATRATDRLAKRLRPQLHATLGRVRALADPAALDPGIEACRTGRRAGLRWWRRATAADTSLARLLLWRALRPGESAGSRHADIREATRLARRRCRPWHRPGTDERIVLHDALAARDALTGGGTVARRRRAWLRAVDAPSGIAERARLATAWVEWAVGTGDPELAAEAYQHLVTLVPLDAAARYGASARQRVLAAAQEHTEEAGYWLARTRRYREAVVVLETGRAVGLSGATGTDPLAHAVTYDDVTAAGGDGALVYVAAAKAGGYALVVAAGHDPQFVSLPKLDRARVATLVAALLPGTDAGAVPPTSGPGVPGPDVGAGRGEVRDVARVRPRTDPLVTTLRTLWHDGLEDLLLHSVRGRVVTLVPVGLLSLLPLHAAGQTGEPGDRTTEWRHTGHFSAIRYAPNARSLRRCRDTARELPAGRQRLLAVDVPDASGAGAGAYLWHVARETTEVSRRWSGDGTVRHDCTWAQFRDSADGYTVWHLACHGSARPYSIMDSRLYFADRQVTLAELRRTLRPGRRRLAVLSACESNLTDATLPNEVVGLPSALLQVGFAGVVASSWKVDDLATTYLMTAFYRYWCGEGQEPAVALNLAQRWLRTATVTELTTLLPGVPPPSGHRFPYLHPRHWAAFAYTGA